MAHGQIASTGALVCPDEDIPHQLDPVQFINAENALDIALLWHFCKREGTEVALDEGNVCRQSRYALVDILEGLQVGQMDHDKKSLLERV
ncbi:hypothetical protein [Gloeobacter kilaueensis]|uniref:hypothetical protein n=1 Tax=Gloeobacter kilaueensis TaxID=1416614 RepID=UPI001CB6BF7C|nr:hypothetical protein [Gloeobacter kilaueensis]